MYIYIYIYIYTYIYIYIDIDIYIVEEARNYSIYLIKIFISLPLVSGFVRS